MTESDVPVKRRELAAAVGSAPESMVLMNVGRLQADVSAAAKSRFCRFAIIGFLLIFFPLEGCTFG